MRDFKMKGHCHSILGILSLFMMLLMFSLPLYSQITIHKNLNVEKGLIYSQVLCAYQDQKGYMWFGTSSGVSCWDGQKFKNYHSTDQIRFDNVKLITEISNNQLVFVTRHTVLLFDNGVFTISEDLPEDLIIWIEQAVKLDDGNIYLAGQHTGVWCFNGVEYKPIMPEEKLKDYTITTMLITSDDNLLLGTRENGLLSLDKKKFLRTNVLTDKNVKNLSWLHQHKNGQIIIGTKGYGLLMIDNDKVTSIDKSNGLPSNNVNHMYEDTEGKIYVATDEGVAILLKENIINAITPVNGLTNSFSWFVTADTQGNIYICTDGGGVNIYRPDVYQTYNKLSGLPNETVWSILETANHQYYFATDYGVAYLDPKKSSKIHEVKELSDYMVITIFESGDGTLFFGTNESGVCIKKSDQYFRLDESDGLTSNSVWSIAEDNTGRIYFGTYDGGICTYENGNICDTIDTEDGLANNYIVSAYTAADGYVYFGLDNGGVYRVNDGKLDENSVLLPELTIWSFLQGSNKTLYMGTDKNGLISMKPSALDTITIADGLSNNAILGIMEDEKGRIYLTTDNGMNILDFSHNPLHIRHITHEDGLASSECNQGAYLKDSEGNLWVGTIRGVTKYNPSADQPALAPPRTHITHIRVFDHEIQPEQNNILSPLSYYENYLQFQFIGIDFVAPHKVTYRYRLNKTETDWIHTDYPQVQLANLEDNSYCFEVQSGNEWGIWSESAAIEFAILPPFWETWWFRLLAILIIGGMIGGFIYSRIRSLLMIERVRAKIAADLHDDIGAGLSEINILSAVAETKTPPEAKKYVQGELNRISHTAGQIIDSMSDIVWMVNPKKDSVTDLVSRLKDVFNDVMDAKGIRFHSENIHLLKKIKLHMESRQFLYLIFKEAMNNAVKYSECSEIAMKISVERKKLSITLQDNGKGFSKDTLKAGNGLINMQERAKKIKGELRIESQLGSGTVIEFRGKT
jgi:ligand-binding sensor domain-containing protein/two-component sensor histidine kinase